MILHLISGLPRSGSTLLAAILKQNPRFRAGIESPLADIVTSTIRTMSTAEAGMFISESQRRTVLESVIRSFYAHQPPDAVIFDSNRAWCSLLPLIVELSPSTRVVCCVRSPAWILDSMERQVQKTPLSVSRIFNHEVGSVYSRVEIMATKHFMAPSLNALRTAWFGDNADRLIAVRYNSLCEEPAKVIAELYRLLGEPPFEHDFQYVQHSEPEFDARLGFPSLHSVSGAVAARPRHSVLPDDLFRLYDTEFWASEGGNPRGVTIL